MAKNNTTSRERTDINIFRRFKRKIRSKVNWNNWPMKYQLRVHLFTLFGMFFLVYFLGILLYANFDYKSLVVKNIQPYWAPMIQNRLEYATQSVSTTMYMADKVASDAAVRLQRIYSLAAVTKDTSHLFPVKHTAYPLFEDFARLERGEVVYGAGAYCENSA